MGSIFHKSSGFRYLQISAIACSLRRVHSDHKAQRAVEHGTAAGGCCKSFPTSGNPVWLTDQSEPRRIKEAEPCIETTSKQVTQKVIYTSS